ncbi:MAG: HAD family hydrolase [Pseudomonadota bacterium]
MKKHLVLIFSTLIYLFSVQVLWADDLPSWNDGPAKQAILDFVEKVSKEGSQDFVPEEERIAVFDNDGTLWGEQPYYFQLAFALDRIKAMAPDNPQWKDDPILKAAIDGDLKTIMKGGEPALLEIIMKSHAGMSTEEFETIAREWVSQARHPETGSLYIEMVYQPMLELLDYLRANGFDTWIVSGGGIEFMRPWTQVVYGISPEQVVGSSIKVKYELIDGVPTLVRLPEIDFIDDKAGKPVAINKHIGRRPLAAFGNSDGDLQMIQWTTAGSGPRLGVYIRHTDDEREYAYDRDSHIGRLDKGLDEAEEKGWTVVDMKRDWKAIYPPK